MRIAGMNGPLEQKVLEIYDTSIDRPDVQLSMATFIKANIASQKINEHWLNKMPANGDIYQWLRSGYYVDALGSLDKSILSSLIGHKELDRNSINVLWLAGQVTSLVEHERNALILEDYLLSESVPWHLENAVSQPLYLFPNLHGLVALNHLEHDGVDFFADFRNAASAFREKYGVVPKEMSAHKSSSISDKFFNLSCEIAAISEGMGEEFNPSHFCENIVEVSRRIFGLRPLIVSIAIVAAQQRMLIQPSKCELFDESFSLLERISYAGKIGGRWGYWRRALLAADTPECRLMFSLVLIAQSTANFLVDHVPDFEDFFDKLPVEEWRSLTNALNEFFGGFAGRSSKKPDVDAIRFHSSRFAFVMAKKAPQAFAKQVFLRNFQHYDGDDRNILLFCQNRAIRCASSGDISWGNALEIVGGSNGGRLYYQFADLNLPKNIVDVILNNSPAYPQRLWDRAQTILANSLSKELKPVAQIARREKWFAGG